MRHLICPNCGTMIGTPKKSKRIPSNKIRGTCINIAENIKAFSDTSSFLLVNHLTYGFWRMPYITFLLGLDEAGKLLMIIKNAIEDERDPTGEIVINNWYAHWAKGGEAGEMGVTAVEWLSSILQEPPSEPQKNAQSRDSKFIQDYLMHLGKLKKGYCNERNSMIYIDVDDNGDCHPIPELPEIGFILLDVLLLDVLANIVLKSLNEDKSFIELNDCVSSIRGCRDFNEAMAKVDAIAGTNLRDLPARES